MIQVAILVVLIIIALLIAPWLILAVATAAALYGVYLVAVAVIFILACVAAACWFIGALFFRKRDRPEEIMGPRKSCPSCSVELPAHETYCRSCGSAA